MTYSFPITDPVALAAKVKAAGGPSIDPTQATGTAETHGVTVTWAIDGDHIELIVDHKPWYVSDAMIANALQGFFGGAA